MKLDLKQHLKEMISAGGPSGYEDSIREIIRNAWRRWLTKYASTILAAWWRFVMEKAQNPDPA